MRFRNVMLLLLLIFFGGKIGYYLCLCNLAGTIELSAEEMDIYEAVLRYQIFNSAAGGRGTATAYVRIKDYNPPPEFLKRFRGHQPPVRRGWCFREGAGVLYEAGAIKHTGKDSAIVIGGYWEGNLSASTNTYYLSRKNGVWKVVKDELHWIS